MKMSTPVLTVQNWTHPDRHTCRPGHKQLEATTSALCETPAPHVESLRSRGTEDMTRGPAGYHRSQSEALPRCIKVTGEARQLKE
ncbi:hypothetical protein O3P69_001401 [Scylla paramamosain]|uniref:Uncharacterized protein n=1 Tax=Scylla paramamosain TaxID=85552 RepID=A0AAW0UQ55_SCYPA